MLREPEARVLLSFRARSAIQNALRVERPCVICSASEASVILKLWRSPIHLSI